MSVGLQGFTGLSMTWVCACMVQQAAMIGLTETVAPMFSGIM